ncbi:MAG: MFS transporter [Candidatus Pacebacteria bacterium]|nr:MFS transporter [Candidatus Paceibacterota bacterium]MDR3583560.1 MFS transporter [Candidatus Paceibacterota bacterium]
MRHNEKLAPGKIRMLDLISFLAGLGQAFFLYIMSSYFQLAAGTGNVGFFYLVAYSAMLIIFLNLAKIVRRIGKSDLFFLAVFLEAAVTLALLFVSPGFWGIVLVVVYIILVSLVWLALDLILESYSSDRWSGRIRGKYLVLMNAGVFLGPWASAVVLEKQGYYGIFLILLVFNLAIGAIGIFALRGVNHRFRGQISVVTILKKVEKRKDISRIFFISFVLEFFYALMIIYAPLYLLKLGFNWERIGLIFTVMLLPFFLQYHIGLLADKRLGEKEMLAGAIALMGFSTLAIYFITSREIVVWAAILFATRIGAAAIEVLRDSYFYKRIDGHDVDLINVFRTSRPLGYILATAASTLLLLAYPLKSIFILIALVVFAALWPALRLDDNKSDRVSV